MLYPSKERSQLLPLAHALLLFLAGLQSQVWSNIWHSKDFKGFIFGFASGFLETTGKTDGTNSKNDLLVLSSEESEAPKKTISCGFLHSGIPKTIHYQNLRSVMPYYRAGKIKASAVGTGFGGFSHERNHQLGGCSRGHSISHSPVAPVSKKTNEHHPQTSCPKRVPASPTAPREPSGPKSSPRPG